MKISSNINRRDFINGMALSLAAGSTLSPLEILARTAVGKSPYYPPGLTGMRGSHDGSFEIAHAKFGAGTPTGIHAGARAVAQLRGTPWPAKRSAGAASRALSD